MQRLQTYCSEDLGGFYLDVLKDRLYTTAARQPRAALGADRARAHPRRAAAADGADPVVHRRGGVAHRCIPDDADDLRAHVGGRAAARCRMRTRCVAKWDAHPRGARGRAEGARGRCARRARSARRCRPRSRSTRARAGLRRARARSATTCASCSSRRRRRVRARRRARGRRRRRARTRSASAAGTSAPTSAPTPAHPTLCGRCVANLFGAGEPRACLRERAMTAADLATRCAGRAGSLARRSSLDQRDQGGDPRRRSAPARSWRVPAVLQPGARRSTPAPRSASSPAPAAGSAGSSPAIAIAASVVHRLAAAARRQPRCTARASR